MTATIVTLRSTLGIDPGHNHACYTFASLIVALFLQAHLLTFLLMSQDLFFVLLETDEVKVKVLDTILLEQVLSNQTRQIDACLCQSGPVLVERRVTLNG